VRLLQGTADEAVPFEMALRLVQHIDGDDVRAILLKDADHRLSGERELALLAETIHGLPDPIMT
jgi:dipeptidyl aminopeptidase/acylaminoacyl peptidase